MTISIQLDKRWLVFQNAGFLLLNQSNAVLQEEEMTSLKSSLVRHFSLGIWDNIDYYCAELDPSHVISSTVQAVPLRHALSVLHRHQYALAVKASSVLNWDKHHQYCGSCGIKTYHPTQQFERICPQCQLSFFPRISPSIIVRIRKDDQLLMARSPHFPVGVYGLIAGFVDSGESLEEAVLREVKEEVGILIKNIQYFNSQPWPFPDSLMVAFTADYDSGEIVIDDHEISEAGWYKYDQLPGWPSMQYSIAYALIDDFVAKWSE